MKKTYDITVRVNIDVRKEKERRVFWISCKSWKHGDIAQKNVLVNTKMAKVGSRNAHVFGEEFFRKVKEMAIDDKILKD
jgi:hypothetical protein